jgi:hypothetical protein
VDAAGNVYVANFTGSTIGSAVVKWSPVTQTLTTVIPSATAQAAGLAVDGSGNIYYGDAQSGNVYEWIAATGATATLASSAGQPFVALDATGNVYINEVSFFATDIAELPIAFVKTSTITEGAAAGTDSLAPVLPITQNLHAPFAPLSSDSWLTISGVNNGVVSFAFTANPSPSSRTATLTVLGQSIAVTQSGNLPRPQLSVASPVSGTLQITFTNNPGGTFTVIGTTNLALPYSSWTSLGPPVESPAGFYTFSTSISPAAPKYFYAVVSP